MRIIGKSGIEARNVTLEVVIILFVLIVFGVVSLVGANLFSSLKDEIISEASIGDISVEANNTMVSMESRYAPNLDGAFGLMFGLLWIVVLVASYLIDSRPAFFIISLVLLIALLVAGALLSNSLEEFMGDSDMNGSLSQFPITNFILTHLVIVVLGIGGSIAIVQFAKRSQ